MDAEHHADAVMPTVSSGFAVDRPDSRGEISLDKSSHAARHMCCGASGSLATWSAADAASAPAPPRAGPADRLYVRTHQQQQQHEQQQRVGTVLAVKPLGSQLLCRSARYR
jgi:hypothetical protein